MSWVAIAAPSRPAAEAGGAVAEGGGNAVDCAAAAALVALTMDVGLVSPTAGGFVTMWPADGAPVVIDANAEMPGRAVGGDPASAREIWMSYGGGMHTVVGFGSVATPGAFAGLERAVTRHGNVTWRDVVEPARRHAEAGFPLRTVSRRYLEHSGEPIYGWHEPSRRLLFGHDGLLLQTGDPVVIPNLGDTLQRIGRFGADEFYTGRIGKAVADAVVAGGGKLSREDMAAYRAVDRDPIMITVGGWRVATNPPPALGGAALAAMVTGLQHDDPDHWVEVQAAVLGYRRSVLDGLVDNTAEVARLLAAARRQRVADLLQSPSTIHVSAVDDAGDACAVTLSAGYGSGALVEDCGLYLNNSLGEIELGSDGFAAWKPGDRLPSNMAPTVGRCDDGSVFAIGSPGAARITTALAQVIVAVVAGGVALDAAVELPRIHVDDPDGPVVAAESGVAFQGDWDVRWFDERDMYFGGVQAAGRSAAGEPVVAADSRRGGGTVVARR